MNFAGGEVLLVNKPSGWTSFDVVNKLRYAIKKRTGERLKVGHAGTLDPLATGLLIICTGKMTKSIELFTGFDKVYTGTMYLGASTASYDCETPEDQNYPTEHITHQLLVSSLPRFIGEIEQIPPIYSAVKVDGRAAYISARKGEDVVLKSRKVRVDAFEITDVKIPEISFMIKCSKGTYIRSLVHDYGKSLMSGAYMTSLCRTEVGNFKLSDALSVERTIDKILNE